MRKRLILLGVGLFALCFLQIPNKTLAADPSLVVAASPTTVNNGGSFTVYVRINSANIATNAYKATLSYSNDLVQATANSTGGSICQFWVAQPSFNNGNGTAGFECGLPSPGFQSGGGNLASFTFRATALGTATISVTGGSEIYGNDATGNNIIAGRGSVNVNIVSPPPPAIAGPKISSTTHPDPEVWYQAQHVALVWESQGGVTGYSYDFNKIADNVPDSVVDSSELTFAQDVLDGEWYFHIKSYSPAGWSQTTHFKVLVDSSPPNDFIPEISPSGVIKTSTPQIHFNTTDDGGGIDYYEVRIDEEEYVRAESPFTTSPLRSGKHTVTVKAVDYAGNVTYGKNEFQIFEVPPPYILNKDNGQFVFGEEILIRGEAVPDSDVNVYLDSYDRLLKTVRSDSLGNWKLPIAGFDLMPGKYKVFATTVDGTTGILSSMSNVYHFEIKASSLRLGFIVLPWWAVALFLFSLVLLLVLLLIWFLIFFKRRKKETSRALHDLKDYVHKDFDVIEEELEEDLDDTMKDQNVQKRLEVEKEYEDKTEKLLEKEEKKILEEIDKIIEEDENYEK